MQRRFGRGGVNAHSTQIFGNIDEVLTSAGATMTDVVKVTTRLTGISAYKEIGGVRAKACTGGVPSGTAVATPALTAP